MATGFLDQRHEIGLRTLEMAVVEVGLGLELVPDVLNIQGGA
jgi:hypothetical protein